MLTSKEVGDTLIRQQNTYENIIFPGILDYNTIQERIPVPNLLKISRSSYNNIIPRFKYTDRQTNLLDDLLGRYFKDMYLGHMYGISIHSPVECIQKRLTYAIPLYIYLRVQDKIIRYHIFDMPLITKYGSFIVNGVENTVVNQLRRDTGVFMQKSNNTTILKTLHIRGEKQNKIQFDLTHSGGIGQKLKYKIKENDLQNKLRIHTHRSVFCYLDKHMISYLELALMFNNALRTLRYCLKDGMWISTEFLYSTSKAIEHEHTKTTSFPVIQDTKIEEHSEYTKALHRSFDTHLLIDICNDQYETVLPVLTQYATEETALEIMMAIGRPIAIIKKDTIHALAQLTNTFSIYLVVQSPVQKRTSSTSMHVMHQYRGQLKTKKLNLDKWYPEWYDKKKENLYPHITLSTMGRYKLNKQYGTREYNNWITASDLIKIVRSLLDKTTSYDIINHEDDICSKKCSTIGRQIEMYLKTVLISKRFYEESTKLLEETNNTTEAVIHIINELRRRFDTFFKLLIRTPLTHYAEQTNPLTYVAHARKISLMGLYGLNKDNVSLDIRDVHISNYGRICPIETPEGKSVGVITNLSMYTRVNARDEIETPYLKIKNGYLTNTVHYLTRIQEYNKKIALGNIVEHVSKEGCIRMYNNNDVLCRYADQTIQVKSIELDYIEASSAQILSLASSMIPYVPHNDGNRALMGANMQRQAVPLDNIDIPYVGTGIEKVIPAQMLYKRPPISSTFTYTVGDHKVADIWTQLLNNNSRQLCVGTLQNNHNPYTNQKTYSETKCLGSNAPMSYGYAVHENTLALGHNVLIAFISFLGQTFEDSIVISEGLVRQHLFKSTHAVVFKTTEIHTEDTREEIKYIENTTNVDCDGIVKLTSPVISNSVLVCKQRVARSPMNTNTNIRTNVSLRYKGLIPGIVTQCIKYFDTYADALEDSTYNSRGLYTYSHLCDKKNNQHIQQSLLQYLSRLYIIVQVLQKTWRDTVCKRKTTYRISRHAFTVYSNRLLTLSSVRIGTMQKIQHRYMRDGSTYIITNMLIESVLDSNKASNAEMMLLYKELRKTLVHYYTRDVSTPQIGKLCLSALNTVTTYTWETLQQQNGSVEELCMLYLLTEGVATFLCNYLKKTQDILIQEHSLYISSILTRRMQVDLIALDNNMKNEDPQDTNEFMLSIITPKMVKIVVISQHEIQAGDKLTGRHGNKGIISRIMPIDEMPYLKNGRTIDIVLNPLGVSSRMNLGQLFEISLGAVSSIHTQPLQSLLNCYTDICNTNIRAYLYNIYTLDRHQKQLNCLDNISLSLLCNKISDGLYVSSPAFSELKDSSMEALARKHNITSMQRLPVINTLTGTSFDNEVLVGYMYMVKLNHLVDFKLHARNTGGYTYITQQAPKGKKNEGGQRIGEMEMWAFQAYGAAYTLQELITCKADSIYARKQLVPRVYAVNNYLDLDIPRTFYLLRDELRVIGIDITILGKELKTEKEIP